MLSVLHRCTNFTWWRHQMGTFSALLAICAGNLPLTGEFLSQRQVTRSFDVFIDLSLKNCYVNNRETGNLRRHRAHYDVTVMLWFGQDFPIDKIKKHPVCIDWCEQMLRRLFFIYCYWSKSDFLDFKHRDQAQMTYYTLKRLILVYDILISIVCFGTTLL